MTSLLFLSIGFSTMIHPKGIGFSILIICSSAVMISGIESVSNKVSYFDRGFYQFMNLCLLFTGISFILEKKAAYYQLAVYLFLIAWVLKGEVSDNVVWCLLLTSLTTITKNMYYLAYAYPILSAVYLTNTGIVFEGADDKYRIVLFSSLWLAIWTCNTFVMKIKPEYEEIAVSEAELKA
jgi:hypothetical protein